MSQHTFHDRGYHVLCGWDRPLQGFFLVIEKSDELQYSNLFEVPLVRSYWRLSIASSLSPGSSTT